MPDADSAIAIEERRARANLRENFEEYAAANNSALSGDGVLIGDLFSVLVLDDGDFIECGLRPRESWPVVVSSVEDLISRSKGTNRNRRSRGRSTLSNGDTNKAKGYAVYRGMKDGFVQLLRDGTLLATGEVPTSRDRIPIERGYWSTWKYQLQPSSHELLTSQNEEKTVEFRLIRVHLPKQLPVDPSEMNGSIGAVFKNLVLRDPKLQRLYKTALQTNEKRNLPDPDGGRFGSDFSDYSRAWPTDPNLIFMDDGQGGWSKYVPDRDWNHAQYSKELAAGMSRFLEPLRLGKIIAEGHLVSTSERQRISSAIWEAEKIYLDPVNHRIGRFDNDADHLAIKWLWEGVVLEAAVTEPSTADSLVQASPRSKGGRPSIYLWEEAFEGLVIMLGQKGHPETGTELADMMLECLEGVDPDNIPDKNQVEKWLREHHRGLWNYVKK